MIVSFIKNFAIIIYSLYTYKRLLNLKITSKNIIIDMIFTTFLSYSIYFIRLYYLPLAIPIMIVFSLIFITLTSKIEPGLSITTTIISFGISYTFFAVSALFAAVILNFFGADYFIASNNLAEIYLICIAWIQLLLISIPFKFRRLKSGMPFLRSKGGSDAGVFINVILLCCVIIFSSDTNTDLIYIIPIVLIFLLGVLILFWWRRKLGKVYIEKLRANEVQSLRNTIKGKEEQIEQLKQHNDFLAKIVHRDNKLIPAMEFAVKEYLQSFVQREGGDTLAKGQLLLEHLKTISCERSGIITEYQSANKKLPSTDVISVDALTTYMFNKARADGTEFELTISGSVKYLVENIISESDLYTILADLIENAMIATKNSHSKRILVSISVSDGYYLIDIFDSGIPFELETIVNLGKNKITTHADNGGSGIGLTTAFEIFKKYSSSFLIEEFADESPLFTKKISVRFDNQNQYVIKTARDCEIKAISQRTDMITMS